MKSGNNHIQSGSTRPFPVLMINSIFSYLLGLMLATFFYGAITIITANSFYIPVQVDFGGISFPISDYSSLWSADAIRLIFIAGPAACLLFGFIFLGLSINLSGKMVFLRDLSFWLAFHGINLALGGIIAGVLTSSGFAYFAKWIYLNESARFFVALIAIFLLAFTGMMITKLALQSAPSLWYIKSENRNVFLFSRFFVPWLAGTIILGLIRYPTLPLHDLILLATPIIMMAAIWGNSKQQREEDFELGYLDTVDHSSDQEKWRASMYSSPKRTNIRWFLVLSLVLLLAIYRIIFHQGVVFG